MKFITCMLVMKLWVCGNSLV